MKNILGNSIRELRKSKKNDASRACEKNGIQTKHHLKSRKRKSTRQLDEQDILTYAEALEVEPQMLFDLKRPSTPKNVTDSLLSALTDKVTQLTDQRKENVLNYVTQQLKEQLEEL